MKRTNRKLPLRALLADPKPLPADCGYIHPQGAHQARYSRGQMRQYDAWPKWARVAISVAGNTDVAMHINSKWRSEDMDAIEAAYRALIDQHTR